MVRLKVIYPCWLFSCAFYFNSTMVRLKEEVADKFDVSLGNFNSTMVRLKEVSEPQAAAWLGNFNSTMVRLKADFFGWRKARWYRLCLFKTNKFFPVLSSTSFYMICALLRQPVKTLIYTAFSILQRTFCLLFIPTLHTPTTK